MARKTPPHISWATRRNYLRSVRYVLASEYGSGGEQLEGLSVAIEQQPRYSRLPPSNQGEADRVGALMRIAWQTEVILRRPRIVRDDELSVLSIHWGTIQLYYAVYSAASAWLEAVKGDHAPKRRRPVLNVLADYVCKGGLLPSPWGAACHTYLPVSFCGEIAGYEPQKVSHLSSPGPGQEMYLLCLALKVTRRDQLQAKVDKWKTDNGKKRAPEAVKRQLDRFSSTTVFDLLWDMRVRAQYVDAEYFTFASQYPDDAVRYLESLCRIAAASLLLFEKLLVRTYGRSSLTGMARDFISSFKYANDTVGLRIGVW